MPRYWVAGHETVSLDTRRWPRHPRAAGIDTYPYPAAVRRDMSDGAAATAEANGITARYAETDGERLLTFDRDGETAAVAQNLEGYAMLKVRATADGDELERYYGFEMALDHAAELLCVDPAELPIPEPAADLGM